MKALLAVTVLFAASLQAQVLGEHVVQRGPTQVFAEYVISPTVGHVCFFNQVTIEELSISCKTDGSQDVTANMFFVIGQCKSGASDQVGWQFCRINDTQFSYTVTAGTASLSGIF